MVRLILGAQIARPRVELWQRRPTIGDPRASQLRSWSALGYFYACPLSVA
eukprot:SAG31_NODE_8891_length_1367_cov_1.627760_2_plen_49_part_01